MVTNLAMMSVAGVAGGIFVHPAVHATARHIRQRIGRWLRRNITARPHYTGRHCLAAA